METAVCSLSSLRTVQWQRKTCRVLFHVFWWLETQPSHCTLSLKSLLLAWHQCTSVSCSLLLMLYFYLEDLAMLGLRLDWMILKVFSILNDSLCPRIYFIITLRMMLGCPPAQLTNLYSGTLCKSKSTVSVTSPVRSIGQKVTNKVPRYSSDLDFSLQVSYIQKISRS